MIHMFLCTMEMKDYLVKSLKNGQNDLDLARSNHPGCRVAGIAWYLNGKHYLMFGLLYDNYGYTSNELWEYNPEADTWAWISGNLAEEKQTNYTFPKFGTI